MIPDGIVRWRFEDMENNDTVVVPLNPNEMSTPTRARLMQWGSYRGNLKGQERSGPPAEWSFTGVLLTESHYDLLLAWTKRLHVLRVTDHLDRTFEIIIQKFDPVERPRAALREWRADYTMTCLLLRRIS